jgi:hypothetical protein
MPSSRAWRHEDKITSPGRWIARTLLMCHLHVNRNGWNIAVRRCRRAVVRYEFWLKELVRIKEEAALAGKSPLPRGISLTPMPLRASRFPRRVTLRRAVVLGALALSQGHRRPRPRSRRPSRAGAAAASGFRGLADRDKRRRAHRARQERACGLGLRQLRPRRADHAGGANLEDARPPRRSHLLVGAIASPALPRDIVCVQRHASAPVDGHRALGYGPAADLRSMVREADAATTRPC